MFHGGSVDVEVFQSNYADVREQINVHSGGSSWLFSPPPYLHYIPPLCKHTSCLRRKEVFISLLFIVVIVIVIYFNNV
jgi:hypothetical protein